MFSSSIDRWCWGVRSYHPHSKFWVRFDEVIECFFHIGVYLLSWQQYVFVIDRQCQAYVLLDHWYLFVCCHDFWGCNFWSNVVFDAAIEPVIADTDNRSNSIVLAFGISMRPCPWKPWASYGMEYSQGWCTTYPLGKRWEFRDSPLMKELCMLVFCCILICIYLVMFVGW